MPSKASAIRFGRRARAQIEKPSGSRTVPAPFTRAPRMSEVRAGRVLPERRGSSCRRRRARRSELVSAAVEIGIPSRSRTLPAGFTRVRRCRGGQSGSPPDDEVVRVVEGCERGTAGRRPRSRSGSRYGSSTDPRLVHPRAVDSGGPMHEREPSTDKVVRAVKGDAGSPACCPRHSRCRNPCPAQRTVRPGLTARRR